MSHDEDPLARLLSPRSMAIVGVSPHADLPGHLLLVNALAGGFAGEIHLVARQGGEVLGHPVKPDLAACPRGVELVVLAVPASSVLAEARAAAARGAAALVVMSDGFGDPDQEEAPWEGALAKLCRERGLALLGPNSLGVIHRQRGVNVSLTCTMPPTGGVSLFSQSGSVGAAALEWLASRQLGLCKMISPGHQAGITDAQCISHLAHDPETRVIACYLEWITEGRSFLKAATEASLSKPVVLLLGGGSACRRPGVREAGCLIHSQAIFNAACERTGILRAADFQGWLDAVLALARSPLPANHRVAIVTNGGGPGVLTSDLLDRQGLLVAGLADHLAAALPPRLAPGGKVSGPLDLGGAAPPEHYRAAVEAVDRDEGVDALVVVVAPHPLASLLAIVPSLLPRKTGAKPLLAVLMGGDAMRSGVAELDRLGLAGYPTPERAVTALVALDRYGRWRRRGPRIIPRFAANQGRVRRLIQRCSGLGRRRLVDLESKAIVQAYGVVIPEGEVAATVNEALEIAERLGYPIAMHLLSPELHLVRDMAIRHVDVAGSQAVRDGFDLLTLRFAHRVPEGRLEGVFIEKVLSHGRPMRMGMKRDRQFGPLLQVGSADPLALEEAFCQLAPITLEEAVAMVRSGRGQRSSNDSAAEPGTEPGDDEWPEVAEVLQRLGQLAMDFPEITCIQINPLRVRRAGLPPVATECEIWLDQPGDPS